MPNPLAARAAHEHREAEDEEDVPQDGANDRASHDLDLPLPQGSDGDDQLRGVTKGRVEEAAGPFANPRGKVLGGVTHPGRQGNDGQSRSQKDPYGTRVKDIQEARNGDEDQEEVEEANALEGREERHVTSREQGSIASEGGCEGG